MRIQTAFPIHKVLPTCLGHPITNITNTSTTNTTDRHLHRHVLDAVGAGYEAAAPLGGPPLRRQGALRISRGPFGMGPRPPGDPVLWTGAGLLRDSMLLSFASS